VSDRAPEVPTPAADAPAADLPNGTALNGTAPAPEAPDDDALERERHELLERVVRALEGPMTVLGFAWLALVVVELTRGLSPFLEAVNLVIWGLFVLQFVVELAIAPRRGAYLRHNWLTAIALVVPALRVVRVVRVVRLLRAARGARLLRVVSTANRGMRALGRVMGRRGLGYVVTLTLLVDVLGAAGIYAFERDATAPRSPGTARRSGGPR
jgi:voltage-gated potassium channel